MESFGIRFAKGTMLVILVLGLMISPVSYLRAQQAPPAQLQPDKPATDGSESPVSSQPAPPEQPQPDKPFTDGPVKAGERRSPVIMEGKKTLPVRLLTRPFSNIYEKPDENAKPVIENVPTFSIFYAYSTPKQTAGWYEVGTDNRGNVKGWIKEKDVIEWKQYLTMAFTNPAERKQALFFRDKESVAKLIGDPGRGEKLQSIRQTIDEAVKDPQKEIPDDFLIVAREPSDFASLHQRPYLMPVLSSEAVELDGKESVILEIATTVKGASRPADGPTTKPIIEDSPGTGGDPGTVGIREWKADVVFVIDTTASMGPYIDLTREVVKESAKKISESGITGKISYGMVAYRDNVEKIPGIEYTAKVFCNLEEGADINTFYQKVSEVREASVGSVGFDEDVWAGIMMALNDPGLKTRPDASLFLVHIGDASAHDHPHPLETTGLNAQLVRQAANDRQPQSAVIATIHLISPGAKQTGDWQKAATQFRTIDNQDPKSQSQLYFPVENADPQLFREKAEQMVSTFIESLRKAQGGTLATPATPPPQAPGGGTAASPTAATPTITSAMEGAIMAAQIEWLGSRKSAKGEVKIPTDIQAWTVDHDLESTNKRPMDVRLLITKNNLDQLKKSLERVMEAGLKTQVSGADFFKELQGVMAEGTVAPEMMSKKLSIAKVGLLPEFVDGLPYRSEVLDMTSDDWSTLSADGQAEFLHKIEAKVTLYQNYYSDQSKWVELNKGDEPGDQVMFLDLNALP